MMKIHYLDPLNTGMTVAFGFGYALRKIQKEIK